MIPINSTHVQGPCVFSAAVGIHKFLRVGYMLDKLCLQPSLGESDSEAGSIIKKSSSMEHLVSKIHSIASESWLKR